MIGFVAIMVFLVGGQSFVTVVYGPLIHDLLLSDKYHSKHAIKSTSNILYTNHGAVSSA